MTKAPLHSAVRPHIPKVEADLTDAQLLDAFIARGDEKSFQILFGRYAEMVCHVCQGVLHDSHEAEDATQATFMVFARKAKDLGKDANVEGWLHKVAYHAAQRIRYRLGRHGIAEELTDVFAAPECADELELSDLRHAIEAAIERLPEKYRRPLVLCYLEGLSCQEAASRLGCGSHRIRYLLYRGRQRLCGKLLSVGIGANG